MTEARSAEDATMSSDLVEDRFRWEPVLDVVAPSSPSDVDAGAAKVSPARPSLLDHGWWTLVVGFIAGLIGSGPLSDNSFLTHTATGRLILDGQMPFTDRFTWSSEGTELVVHSWGSSVLYAIGDSIGSGAGIRLMIATFTSVGMLALWRLSAPAKANVLRLALVSVSMVLAFAWWNERPQTVAYMALALGLVIVSERRSPWLLVPLFFVWTNLHGSFAMGVPFLGVVMFLRVVEHRSLGRREFAEVGAMAGGIVLAGLVNPYGFDLITFPIAQLQRKAIVLIAEWQPLPLDSFWSQLFLAQVAVIVGVLVWRRRWLRLAMALGLVYLSLDAARYAPLSAIMLVPIVAPALAGLGTEVEPAVRSMRLRWGLGVAAALIVIGTVVATPSYDLSSYPQAEAAEMEARGWIGADRDSLPRIFTHDFVGNYLEWRNGTEAKPWIDDRAEVHPFETLLDYSKLLTKGKDYAAIAARHPHDVVLWLADEQFAKVVRADASYEVIADNDDWILACVKASGFCDR